jgi:inorganic pyrophosphatase
VIPDHVDVHIEVPRGGLVKPRADGSIAFVSPLPCPFNYGCIPAIAGMDGDPLDAIVLGPRLPRGHRATLPVRGVVRFLDAGRADDKVICGDAPTAAQRRAVLAFLRFYAFAKRQLYRALGTKGRTEVLGWSPRGL